MSGPVLVTGGAGCMGGHLSRAFLERGRDVIAFDLAPRVPDFVSAGKPRGKLEYVRGDVTDPGALVDVLVKRGATDVIHTAGLLGHQESLDRPRQFLRVNAEAIWQICDLARNIPAIRRIVHVSTRSVYGCYTAGEGPLYEDFAPRPEAMYGASKMAGDLALVQYRAHFGLDAVAGRITGVYGPHQTYPNPLSEMVDAAIEGRAHTRETGGDYLVEFTYVKDLAAGLLSLLDAERLEHPVYNVSSGVLTRLADVAAIVRKVVPGAKIELGAGMGSGSPRAALAVERLAAQTGFRARWSLEEGIREFVAWRRSGDYGASV